MTHPTQDDTPAMSARRVEAVMQARALPYVTDDDNMVGMTWEDRTYWCEVTRWDQSVITVWSMWEGVLPLETLRLFIARWHSENYWPRLSFEVDDFTRVTATVSADFATGVADRQLDAMISMSVAKIREAFRELTALEES